MYTNRNGYNTLDDAVAAEVRSDIARKRGASVKGIAEALGMRRATLSARLNCHAPFSPSLLAAVAAQLGSTASDYVARAERTLESENAALAAERVAR